MSLPFIFVRPVNIYGQDDLLRLVDNLDFSFLADCFVQGTQMDISGV